MRYPLLVVLALAAGLPTANAIDNNSFAQCSLVPWASFDLLGRTTTVGLMARDTGMLYYSYFDQNGDRLSDGELLVRNDSLTPVVLDQVLSPGLAETPGFLLFCLDDNEDGLIDANDNPDLASNAFYVDLLFNDVAYIPTLPVFFSDLDQSDPGEWQEDPLRTLAVGANASGYLHMQYLIDGLQGSGEATALVIFSTAAPDSPASMRAAGPGGIANVSVNLPSDRVNVLDLETIAGMRNNSALVGAGFLRWQVDQQIPSAIAFSLVYSATFGALQTLPGKVDNTPQ